MIYHRDLPADFAGLRELKRRITAGEISLGGNCNLNIYGTLDCHSGRRLKRENRVFFRDKTDALASGYRPCAHCLPDEYLLWKRTYSGSPAPHPGGAGSGQVVWHRPQAVPSQTEKRMLPDSPQPGGGGEQSI